jgi:hypothetical protein
MFDFALRSAAKISLRSLKRVPIGGEAAEVLLTPDAEEVVADRSVSWPAIWPESSKTRMIGCCCGKRIGN